MSIQVLNHYFVERPLAEITASSHLGYDTISTPVFGEFLLCRSPQAVSGWMGSIAGQLSLQRCLIGFKSGLWLGHSRTFRDLSWSHSCVVLAMCLQSLTCWKVNLRPCLATVFFEIFNAAEMFWYPSWDLCLDTILPRSSTDNSFNLMAWFLLWHALLTVGYYIDRYVPFQIMSNQIKSNQMYLYSPSYISRYHKVLYSNPA